MRENRVFQANKSDKVSFVLLLIALILVFIDNFAVIKVSLESLAAVLAVMSFAILIGGYLFKK